MKHLTLYIIFVLLPLAGLMGQSCPDTIKLSIVTKFDGQDIGVDILVDNFIVVRGVSIRSLRSNYHIPINQRGQFVRIVAYDAEVRLGTVTVNFSRRGWGRR